MQPILTEIPPLQLEETIWVLARNTGANSYDFDFEAYFQCRRRWNVSERALVIGRFGAAENYEQEQQNLLDAGIELVHSLEEHLRCSTLSGWYPLLQDLTPRSIVFEKPPTVSDIESCFRWPIFLKGERQTSRHQRQLSIIENPEQFKHTIELYASDPVLRWQRVTAREFIPLRLVGAQSPQSLPRAFEFRTFWWKKECVGFGSYWLGEIYAPNHDEQNAALSVAAEAARRVNVPFLVVDVAQSATGKWIVIECNDGQESGCAGISPMVLWRKLIDAEQRPRG